jgi:hypothetical protein
LTNKKEWTEAPKQKGVKQVPWLHNELLGEVADMPWRMSSTPNSCMSTTPLPTTP